MNELMKVYPLSDRVRAAYTELSHGSPIIEIIRSVPMETPQEIAEAVCLLNHIEADATGIYRKLSKLKTIHLGFSSIYELLRQRLADAVKRTGEIRETLGDTEIRAWLAKSPAKVDVLDESQVPPQFIKQTISVQKDKILEHFRKTGEVVPGVEIVTDNTHLRVL